MSRSRGRKDNFFQNRKNDPSTGGGGAPRYHRRWSEPPSHRCDERAGVGRRVRNCIKVDGVVRTTEKVKKEVQKTEVWAENKARKPEEGGGKNWWWTGTTTVGKDRRTAQHLLIEEAIYGIEGMETWTLSLTSESMTTGPAPPPLEKIEELLSTFLTEEAIYGIDEVETSTFSSTSESMTTGEDTAVAALTSLASGINQGN